MKKLPIVSGTLLAFALLSLAAAAQTPAPAKQTSTPAMTRKVAQGAAKTVAPKSDSDVQKCIQDKLAGSKLKEDNLSVAVSGGEATLTGATKIGGHKGNATQFAKRCGATKVTNNITVQSVAKSKPAKPADGGAPMTPKKP